MEQEQEVAEGSSEPSEPAGVRDHRGRFKPGQSGNPGGRPAGTDKLTTIAKKLDPQWLDQLGALGQALRQWQQDVIQDLGGAANLSQAQLTLVERASVTLALLSTVEDRVLKLGARLITKDGLNSLVSERSRLLYSFQQTMGMLGLEKVKAPPLNLTDQLAADFQSSQTEEPA